MVGDFALGVPPAGVAHQAGVDAARVDALLVVVALSVGEAVGAPAAADGVALEALDAQAHGLVLAHLALGVRAAVGVLAGVDALAGHAGLAGGAVQTRPAAGGAGATHAADAVLAVLRAGALLQAKLALAGLPAGAIRLGFALLKAVAAVAGLPLATTPAGAAQVVAAAGHQRVAPRSG